MNPQDNSVGSIPRSGGHTLIELMVVVLLVMLISVGIGTGFYRVLRDDYRYTAQADLLDQAVEATDRIARNLSVATKIVATNRSIVALMPPGIMVGLTSNVWYCRYDVTNAALREQVAGADGTNTLYLIQARSKPRYSYTVTDLQLAVFTTNRTAELSVAMELILKDGSETSTNTTTHSQWMHLFNLH